MKRSTEGAELKITSKAILTFEDVVYDVPVASKPLRLLTNVYGYCKPGELTALMARLEQEKLLFSMSSLHARTLESLAARY